LVLGQDHGVVYRKAELKELVDIHGQFGKLVDDEVHIVKAVLDLREKTVI
jgi:metal transporter CNNM